MRRRTARRLHSGQIYTRTRTGGRIARKRAKNSNQTHKQEGGEIRMIRTLKSRFYDDELTLVELAGNSADTKPTTGIVTGSVFHEVDTAKRTCMTKTQRSGLQPEAATAKRPLSAQPLPLALLSRMMARKRPNPLVPLRLVQQPLRKTRITLSRATRQPNPAIIPCVLRALVVIPGILTKRGASARVRVA